MALRAKEGLVPDKKTVTEGDVVTWKAKVENTGAEPRRLRFEGEATNVRPPLALAAREGPQVAARKTRTLLTFSWVAAVPVPGESKTLRGEVRLVDEETGAVVVRAPLDLYVAAAATARPAEATAPEPERLVTVRRRPGATGHFEVEVGERLALEVARGPG
ncbi:MAG TPA: hypothetical protein VNZ52_10630, partial [Candidatus Thermoplasmatota archaeon]|nr:hypothetical protein [Candidatus Thermoplasmatota archaeon]